MSEVDPLQKSAKPISKCKIVAVIFVLLLSACGDLPAISSVNNVASVGYVNNSPVRERKRHNCTLDDQDNAELFVESCRRLLAEYPDNQEYRYNISKFYYEKMYWKDALNELRGISSKNDHPIEIATMKCNASVKNAFGSGTIIFCSELINLDPSNPIGYVNRCIGNFFMGYYDAAISDCNIAISLDHKNPKAYDVRCDIYYHQRNLKMAIEECSKAIEVNSKYADAYASRARVYRSASLFKEAKEDYLSYLEL